MLKNNTRYMILTPDGYSDFDGINIITKKSFVDIQTENGSTLKCSIDHRVQKEDGFIESQYLSVNDFIKTSSGYSKIISHKILNGDITLYDPVNVIKNNQYYSNNIVSHNCEFLGSTNTVVDTDVLEYLFTQYNDPILLDMQGKFRIFEKPIINCSYVLGVDTAKGTGEHDSVVQVLKITSLNPASFEQVAVFQSNSTDVYLFADTINRISIYYNNGYMMVENNAEGAAVVNRLWWDIENGNLVNTGNKAINLGIRATKNTKPKAVLLMKKLIEDNCLKINDKETVEQLSSFIEEKGRFYGKDLGDDLVSALYWAVYVLQMDVFDDESVGLKSSNNLENNVEIWGILSDVDLNEDFM
jgi:hypothetical protein